MLKDTKNNAQNQDGMHVSDSPSTALTEQILTLLTQSHYDEQNNDFKSALESANDAWTVYQNCDECRNEELEIQILARLSQVYLQRQEFNRLSEFSHPMLELSRRLGDQIREVSALTNLAIVSSVESNYKSAMPLFLEALDKSQKIGLRKNTANCLINIGNIYANLFNYEEALDRYQTALDDYKDTLNERVTIAIHLNIGNLYYASEQYDFSFGHLEKALILAQKSNFSELAAHAHTLLSRTLLAVDAVNEAIEHAQAAAHLMRILDGNVPVRQINLLNLAEIALRAKDTEGAAQLALRGTAAARRVRDSAAELRGFSLLSKIFESVKDYKRAYKSQSIYANRQADYFKSQRNLHALDLEIRHSLREKQRKIEQLTNENQYQALLLDKSSQIELQNEQLRQANAELQQFAYITSHDLKEPLRMIGSFIQIIQKQIGEKLEGDQPTYFQYVTEGVTRMNALLDALLQYTTIGKTEIEREPVDVQEVVNIARTNLKVKIDETLANILCGPMPIISGVQSLLVQLFQNLIGNAIKFRKEDDRPIVLINAEEEGDHWLFKVQDNGIGIHPEHQERIFVIFQRLHTRQKYEGTGIGLAICHKIVSQLGGKIWVESEFGKGATFCFTLPKLH